MKTALLHGHHRGLLTFGLEYKSRAEDIQRYKPKDEITERLRHMWVVSAEAWADIPEAVRALLAEGDKLWAEAILAAYGNITIGWRPDGECCLGNGDVYRENR